MHRWRARFGSLVCLAVLLVLVAAAPASAQTLVVVPFESVESQPDLEWVGESFAEGLTDRLAGNGLDLISRVERLAALDRLGLPTIGLLTRASLVRLGEELEADWVVVGRFTLQGNRLAVWARFLHVPRLNLSAPLHQKGSFGQLPEVQSALAWQILRTLSPNFSTDRRSFFDRVQSPPVSALENLMRGLRAPTRELQARYFLQAARLAPSYSSPAFQLGKLYFEDQDYTTSALWLEKIPPGGREGADARFYLSLSYYFEDDAARAAATLRPLGAQLPVKAVWNNLAVFTSKAGGPDALDYFLRALREDSADSDVHFNLGLHHLRLRQWTAAARALERCLELNPDDTEAQFFSAQVLDGLGRTDEAERVRRLAVGNHAALAASLEEQQAHLDRLKQEFSAALARRISRAQDESFDGSTRGQHVNVHLERGVDFLNRNLLESARAEFTQAVYLDPSSYAGHLHLAEVYRRQGHFPEAVSELKAALWNQDAVPARLRLAKLYLEQDSLEEARQHVRAALALEPHNAEARALADRLSLDGAPANNGSGGKP